MSDKKLYTVRVETHQDVIVAAVSKEEAEKVALANYQEDLVCGGDVEIGLVQEITEVSAYNSNVLPWGVSDKDERRNWPVNKWLKVEEKP